MDAAHDTRRQLGQLMVDEGLLTSEQLAHALEEQSRSGRPLGAILVELGFVSAGAVGNALAEQHGGLLKTEFGISAGLQVLPGGAPPGPKPAEPPEVARVTAAAAARIAELEAEVRRWSDKAHVEAAEVARITAAAIAKVNELEAAVQAGHAVRSKLDASRGNDATRISELQQEVAALREEAQQRMQAEIPVEAPAEQAHLLFTHSPSGYTLVETLGPAPASGTRLDVGGVGFVVLRVGASPFPRSRLRCVFLERA